MAGQAEAGLSAAEAAAVELVRMQDRWLVQATPDMVTVRAAVAVAADTET